jgi:hypothetical protein
MKTYKYILIAALTAVIVAGATYSLKPNKTKELLDNISRHNDPGRLKLENGFNSYVKRAFINDGTEVGVISLSNGSKVKYWFKSHHLTGDIGGTMFEFNNSRRIFMAGYFCCELQLPDNQIKNESELKSFINKYDGESP